MYKVIKSKNIEYINTDSLRSERCGFTMFLVKILLKFKLFQISLQLHRLVACIV